MESLSFSFSERELKAYLIMFVYATVSLSSPHDLFHVFSITIHVDHCDPLLYSDHIHLYFVPHFYPTLATCLQMLQLKNSRLPLLHASHQSLGLQVLLTHVVASLLGVHQIKTAEIFGMFPRLILLQRSGLNFSLRHFFTLQSDQIKRRRFV